MIHVPAYKISAQRGISLALVLGIATVIAVVIYFLQVPLNNQMKSLHVELARKRLDIIVLKISGTIQNDLAWSRTIQTNPNMACFATNSCPNESHPLVLYSADGSLVVDSTNPNSGFTLEGTICPTSSGFNPTSNNLNCPFQVILSWSPVGTAPQRASIVAQVRTNRNLRINTTNQMEVLTVVRGQYEGTLDAACTQMGGTLDQNTNRCTFPFQRAEGQTCPPGERFLGISSTTNDILCEPIRAATTAPCTGPVVGFNPDGSLNCGGGVTQAPPNGGTGTGGISPGTGEVSYETGTSGTRDVTNEATPVRN